MIFAFSRGETGHEPPGKHHVALAREGSARATEHAVLAGAAGTDNQNEMTMTNRRHITLLPSRHTRRTAGMPSDMRT